MLKLDLLCDRTAPRIRWPGERPRMGGRRGHQLGSALGPLQLRVSLLSSHKIFKMTAPTTTPQIFLLRTGEWFGLLVLQKCATMLVFNFTAVQRFVKTQSFRRPIC